MESGHCCRCTSTGSRCFATRSKAGSFRFCTASGTCVVAVGHGEWGVMPHDCWAWLLVYGGLGGDARHGQACRVSKASCNHIHNGAYLHIAVSALAFMWLRGPCLRLLVGLADQSHCRFGTSKVGVRRAAVDGCLVSCLTVPGISNQEIFVSRFSTPYVAFVRVIPFHQNVRLATGFHCRS